MNIPKEAERLMKVYNSMSKEEFARFIKTDEQAKADMEVTIKWLEKELEPFVEVIKQIADDISETLQPLIDDVLAKQNNILACHETFSLGA